MHFRVRFAGAFVALCVTTAAVAQSPLDELRSAPDRDKLATWIQGRVQTIVTSGATAGQAALELRSEFNGPDPFRAMYAQILLEQTRARLRETRGPAAARLLAAAAGLGEGAAAELTPLLSEALAHPDAGARAAAAAGLRSLRARLAPGGPAFGTAVAALRKAGRTEASHGALKAIYLALDYSDAGAAPAEPRVLAEALADILDARAARLDANSPLWDSADPAGLRALLAVRAHLDDAGRKKAALAAGRMLRHAAAHYISGARPLIDVKDDAGAILVTARDAAENVIEDADRALRELLDAPTGPNVANGMKRGRREEVRDEFNRWNELLRTAAGSDVGALP
ncbi:MAG: hypothetical protein HRU75_01210 [Planctomycetia bacterium]|nr:MAG: hypothetical protein HRU75_01210 [Planctomycetia bacterium]